MSSYRSNVLLICARDISEISEDQSAIFDDICITFSQYCIYTHTCTVVLVPALVPVLKPSIVLALVPAVVLILVLDVEAVVAVVVFPASDTLPVVLSRNSSFQLVTGYCSDL